MKIDKDLKNSQDYKDARKILRTILDNPPNFSDARKSGVRLKWYTNRINTLIPRDKDFSLNLFKYIAEYLKNINLFFEIEADIYNVIITIKKNER